MFRRALGLTRRSAVPFRRNHNLRPTVELLEDRVTPSNLQPTPTIFQPKVDAVGNPITQEAQSVFGPLPLLQFQDTAGAGDLANLTATIVWGDGTQNVVTSTSANTATIISLGGNSFEVESLAAGAHIYEEAPSGPVYSVTVTTSSDNSTTGASTQINPAGGVADVPLTNVTGAGNQSVSEGNPVVTLLTFTDPGNVTGNTGGTFDADQTAANPEYKVTINWTHGPTTIDSFNNPGDFILNSRSAAGANFTVVATLPGAEEEDGTSAVSGTITHEAQAAVNWGPFNLTVTEVNPTVNANSGQAITTNEGAATAAGALIGTFSDPGNPSGTIDPGQTAANPEYRVVINWGDGTPTTTIDSFANPGDFVSIGGGNFNVLAPAHTYGEEGTYPVTLTLSHETAAVSGPTQTDTVNVNEVQITNFTGIGNPTLSEGVPAAGVVAHFTDPAGAEPNASDPGGTANNHYTALIHWGDGTSSPGSVSNAGGNNFNIFGSHTYGEEGTYVGTVDLTHESAPTLTITWATVTVNDQQITNLTGGGAPQTINEGTSSALITGLATFTDPAGAEPNASDPGGTPDTHYATLIHWGDGNTSPGTVVVTGANTLRVDAPAHNYAEEGAYQITVDVTHESEPTLTVAGPVITVNEVPVTVGSNPITTTVNEGQPVPAGTFVGSFDDPGNPNGTFDLTQTAAQPEYVVLINWGDGSPTTQVDSFNNPANFQFLGGPSDTWAVSAPAHTYAEDNAQGYTVSFTVTHEALAPVGPATAGTVIVNDVPAPPNPNSGTPYAPVNEGAPTPIQIVGTFSDPGNPTGDYDPSQSSLAPEYSVIINWGDGSTTTLDSFNDQSAGAPNVGIQSLGNGTFNVIAPPHTYLEEGPFNISMTTNHFGPQVVANGGFETGDLSGWSLSGNTGFTGVGNGDPHSGTFALDAGPMGSDGFLTQNVPTIPGQQYVFSYWLENGGAPSGNDFSASFDGGVVQALVNSSPFGYTQFSYLVTATTASTQIEFAFRNDPDFWHLDDVSVVQDPITSGPVVVNSINVLDVPVSINANSGVPQPLPAITEGQSTPGVTTVGTFNDPGNPTGSLDIGETPPEYSVTIAWGDGTTTTVDSNANSGDFVFLGGANNTFAVQVPGHQYTEESVNNDHGPGNTGGVFDITMTVTHGALAPVGPVQTDTVTVNDAILVVNGSGGTANFPEGTSVDTSTGTPLATFTDPGGAEAIGDYTATIHWGDGTPDTTGTITNTGGNTFRVDGTHTYAEESGPTFQITVTVGHESNPTQTVNGPNVTVTEVQLTNFVVAAPASGLTEGNNNPGPLVVATFTDPAGAEPNASDPGPIANHYAATIDWGDGTGPHAATVVNTGGNNFAIEDPTHTFIEEGPLTLTVTVKHEAAALLTGTANYVVQDIAVVGTAGPNFNAVEGGNSSLVILATFTDPGDTPGNLEPVSEYAATVDWGDGSTNDNSTDASPKVFIIQPDPSKNLFEVIGEHVYTEESVSLGGPYAITTTIHHLSEVAPNPIDTVVTGQTAAVADQQINQVAIGAVPDTTEGAGTGPIIGIATFTDPAGNADNEFSATINWGDGTSTTVTNAPSPDGAVNFIFNDAAGDHYSVDSAGHLYAESGTYTINVTLQDDAGSPGALAPVTTPNTTTTVAEAPLTGTLSPPTATEGTSVSNVVLFHFTDADPGAAASDYVATVSWGDGVTESSSISPNITIVSNPDGSFDVVGSHTYLEEGSGTFSVTVVDDSAVTGASTAITIADAPLTVTATAITATEGQNTGLVTVATFTDADPNGNISDYSASIAWGDASNDTGIIVNLGGGVFAVRGSHAYGEEGPFTMTVTVADNGGATNNNSATFTVADAPLTGSITAPSATEGAALNSVLLFHFNDADPNGAVGDYSATVTWGDGGADTSAGANVTIVANTTSGGFDVFGSHTYTEEATGLTLSVSVTDAGGATVSGSTALNVADPAVVATGGFTVASAEGAPVGAAVVVATFTDPGGAELTAGVPTPGEYSATVQWGDGTSSPGTVTYDIASGTFSVLGNHSYAEEGTYTVTVTISHGTAPNATVTSTASVSDPAVVLNNSVLTFSAQENKPSLQQPVATFTDPGGAEVTGGVPNTGEYEATINWGDPVDPNPTSGTITYNAATGTFTVYGSHTYTGEDGTYPITVTVAHGGDAPTSGNTANAMVANPSVLALGNFTILGSEGSTPAAGQTVAVFTDPGGSTTATDFTADIDWGDGNGLQVGAGTVRYNAASGQFIVTGNAPTYTEEGLYTVTVTINHNIAGAAPPITVTDTAMIADPAVVMTGVAVTATEGASVTGTVATFTDPGGAELIAGSPEPEDYVATISWGDSTAPSTGTVTYSAGQFSVSGTHTYAEEGAYTITVTLAHGNETMPSVTSVSTSIATVVDPSVVAGPTPAAFTATEGANSGTQPLVTFTDPGGAEGLVYYSATVDWGDGILSNGIITYDAGSQTFTVSGDHTYAEDTDVFGPYTITVTVNHANAAATVLTNTATIADAQLLSNPQDLTPPTAVEGQTVGATVPVVLFHFFDPNTLEPHAPNDEFLATVQWGDGNTNTNQDGSGTVSIIQVGAGSFDVVGTHTYAEELTGATFSVSVADFMGTSTSQSTTFNVTDPAVVATAGTATIGTEGSATAVTVATFTDPAGPELLKDYSATIYWGDGNVSSGTITGPVGGVFTVTGTNTFVEEGLYAVTVVIHHDSAPDTVVSTSVAIKDPAAVVSSVPALSLVEGSQLQTVVATFTDPGGAEGLNEYSALINWGDGSPLTAGTITTDGAGNFFVSGSHSYADETPAGSPFQVTVTVSHGSAPAASNPTPTLVTVTDAPLTSNSFDLTPPASATEGAPFGPAILFHFGDGNPLATATDFTATVTWGDGNVESNDANVQVVPHSGGGFDVIGSHTYLEEMNGATFKVSILDDGGSTTSQIGSVTVADAALVSTPAGLTPPTPTEGVNTGNVVLFKFTDQDPNGTATDYTAVVSWGDGTVDSNVTNPTAVQIIPLGGTSFEVVGNHTYAEEGTGLTFSVTVFDHGAQTSQSASLTVADAPLSSGGLTPPAATEGVSTGLVTLFHFTDANPTGSAADFTATVTWGDGTVESSNGSGNVVVVASAGGGFDVRGIHTYREEGTGLGFSVTVADNGQSLTASLPINVADAPLTITGTTPPAATEGANTGLVVVATFVDADPNGTATDYNALINWGDGTGTDTGVIVDNGIVGGGRSFSIKGSHVFLEEATGLTMTVTVTDHNATATQSTVFNVADAPLTGTLNVPTPTEGVPLSSVVLFHFNDSDPSPELLGNYTAVVNWGDGTTETSGISPNVSLASNPGGGFDVIGSHTYLEEVNSPAFLPFSVTVTDSGAATASGNAHLTVADASLSISALTPPTGATEGAPVTTTTVFTDADPNGTASDYTATISWGDGTTSTITSTPSAAGQITPTGASFTVTATHTYLEEGTTNKLYSVTITDNNATASQADGTVTIADAALNVVTVTPPSATEGASTGPSVVATFTDADPNGTPSDYTAVVNWGDGTTSTVTSAGNGITLAGGVFSVHASHTYAEESTGLPVTVTVTDADGASASGSATETVADAALTISTVTPPSAVESTNTGLVVVATFSDADPNGISSDYSATINWGDGNTTQGLVVPNGNGTFSVLGGHTFAEEATGLTMTVTVTDNVATATGTATFNVADAPLTGGLLAPSATEGAALSQVVLYHFTDADPNGAKTDYTATVNWGDGTIDHSSDAVPNVLVVADPNGGFNVVGTHTYLEEATGLTFSVSVTDNTATVSGSARINVADASLTIASFAPPASVTEGIPVTTTTTFTDADPNGTAADYTATIVWGDGTTTTVTSTLSAVGQVTASAGGVFTVTGIHTYAEEGTTTTPYSVTINDVGGASASKTGTLVTVADAPLSITGVTPPAAPTEGASTGSIAVATFTDANPTAPLSDFTAVIVWGDGTSDTVTSAGGGITFAGGVYTVHGTHTYAEESSGLTLSVTVTDRGGSTATQAAAVPVTVADAALTIATVTAPSATEGVNTGQVTVATFTDADPAGITSDYTATIAWGDGNTSTGTIVDLGLVGGVHTFGVQGNNTYAEETSAPLTLSVTVTDHVATATKTGSVTVVDAPLFGASQPPAATEGQALNGVVIYHFVDRDPGATATDYTAVVNWGDGTTNSSTDLNPKVSIVASANGGFDVVGSHTYLEEATGISLSVTVTDHTSTVTGSSVINVADAALTVTSVTPPTNATEGQPTGSIPVATFTDADPNGTVTDYVAIVSWGDGTQDTTTNITQSGNVFTVHDSHTFAEEGTGLIMTVTIKDVGGATATGTSAPFNVADAPLGTTNGSLTPPTVLEGQSTGTITVATFTDANPAATPADFTAQISWGDGAVTNGTIVDNGVVPGGHSFSVQGQHLYAEDGKLPFSVTINDKDGESTTLNGTATVNEAPITTSTAVNFSAVQGQGIQNQLIATFTDGSHGTDGDFTASIAWGDGDVSNGTVTYNSGTGLYEIRASKPSPYAQSGVHTATTTIFDDGVQAATGINSSVAVLLAMDNFNPGPKSSLGANWTNQSGAYAINPAGQAFPVILTDYHSPAWSTYNGSAASDEIIDADITLPPSAGPAQAGLVARFTTEGKDYHDILFYYGNIITKGGPNATYTAQICAFLRAKVNVIAQAPLPGFDPTQTHHMRFSVVGNQLTLTIDGQLAVQATNATLKLPGYVGLFGSYSTFDNFVAANPAADPVDLPFTESFATNVTGSLSSAWSQSKGAFSVQNNTATAFNAGVNYATVNTETAVSDAMLKADIAISATSGATAGLVARAGSTADRNEYLGKISYAGMSHGKYLYTAQIVVYRNGKATVLGSKTLTMNGMLTGTLEFDVVGNHLTLSLNGTQLVSSINTALHSGLVGIRGTKSSFKNFSAV
jgi:hypothetical protein